MRLLIVGLGVQGQKRKKLLKKFENQIMEFKEE